VGARYQKKRDSSKAQAWAGRRAAGQSKTSERSLSGAGCAGEAAGL